MRTSGSKQDRVERIVLQRNQPSVVLRHASLEELRELARDTGFRPYGSKDDLLQRVIRQFAVGADAGRGDEPLEEPTARVAEARALSIDQFTAFFGSLRGHELAQILEAFPDVRQSGSKETRVGTLWDASLSEATLLASLRSSALRGDPCKARPPDGRIEDGSN